MPRQTKIIIASIGGGLLIIAIIVAVIMIQRGTDNTPSTTPTETNTNVSPDASAGLPVGSTPVNSTDTIPDEEPVSDEEESEKETILRLSRIVVERYGSYSNRNNFENITRLEAFMTDEFKQKSLAFIDSQQSQVSAEEFYGISTSVASEEIVEYTEGQSAGVRVATRRVESRSNQDTKVFTQYAKVQFQYVNGQWKVSDITWE